MQAAGAQLRERQSASVVRAATSAVAPPESEGRNLPTDRRWRCSSQFVLTSRRIARWRPPKSRQKAPRLRTKARFADEDSAFLPFLPLAISLNIIYSIDII